MKRLHILLLLLVVSLAGLTCRVSPTPQSAPVAVQETPTPSIDVLVDNQDFWDANVYVVLADGVPRRLGTVTGLSKAHFTIRGGITLGSSIALYAKTIGDGTVYRSELVSVLPGLGIYWRIGPQRGADFLMPHYSA